MTRQPVGGEWSGAGREPGFIPRIDMARGHARMLEVCEALERLADDLPAHVDRLRCLMLANSLLPLIEACHRFEEQYVFPVFAISQRNAVIVSRLKAEHMQDRCAAEDLSEALLAYGEGRGWKTAAAAFAGYLLGQLHLFEAYALLGLPLFIMMVVTSALFAFCVMFGRFAARRLPPFAAALAFPCAWTAWEFLSSLVSPHGSFGSLAYSQVSAPALIQGASVFGLWWVSFMICAVASLLALALRQPRRRSGRVPRRDVIRTCRRRAMHLVTHGTPR